MAPRIRICDYLHTSFHCSSKCSKIIGDDVPISPAMEQHYMRNPDCYITGPILIASGYAAFSLHNLPAGWTVSWSLSDSYYNDHCLISNQPSPNQCLIYHDDNHSMMNATLTASVKYNNTTIRTITKSGLYSYNGFWGHYTSGNLSGDIDYTYYFNIRPNATTYITSRTSMERQ